MAQDKTRQLKITLVKSPSGRAKTHQACVRGLGLRRIHQCITVQATPENLGMINRIAYMLRVEED